MLLKSDYRLYYNFNVVFVWSDWRERSYVIGTEVFVI